MWRNRKMKRSEGDEKNERGKFVYPKERKNEKKMEIVRETRLWNNHLKK